MSDRDRLAADLRRIDYMNWTAAENADRLIALGWTRKDSKDLTVDEERLARALHHMAFGGGSDAVPPTYEYDVGFLTYSGEATSASLAAAVAKAYREDTDATD